MNAAGNSIDLTHYLEDKGWMESLALSLVGDRATADDIVQETWLAAVRKGAAGPPPSGFWLARVLRNLAARAHRTAFRRARRERMALRSDRVAMTPERIVQRAELQHRIATVIVALDEPYRSTIVKRFFEDVPVKEIARLQGVAEATTWTRLNRALDHLRVRLDREYGGNRGAWAAILLPAIEIAGLAPSAAAGGAAGTTAGATGSGAAALWTMGGIVMTQKIVFAAAVLGTVAALVGVTVGRATAPRGTGAEELARDYVARATHEMTVAENERLRRHVAALDKNAHRLAEKTEALQTQVADLTARTEEARKAEEARAVAASTRKGPAVVFGPWGELEGIRDADWDAMAGAVEKINAELVALVQLLTEDKPIPVDLQQRIAAENAKLVKYYGSIAGKIPTDSPINGEFSHPVTAANLIAAMLARGGRPLSEEQTAGLASLGEQFDEAIAERRAAHGEATPRLLKLIDELELKTTCYDAMRQSLTDEQRALVIHPEIDGRLQLDTLSPSTMAQLIAKPAMLGSPAELRGRIESMLAQEFEIRAQGNEQVAPIIDRWCQDVQSLLEKPQHAKQPILLDDAIVAGRAQAIALEALLALPDLSEKTRNLLLSSPAWYVPRVTEAAEKTTSR